MAEGKNGVAGSEHENAIGADGSAGQLNGGGLLNADGSNGEVDPGTITEPPAEPRRRAGRPRKPENRERKEKRSEGSAKKEAAFNLKGFSAILFSAHQMASAIFKSPELEISDEESTRLAAAANNVARHYNIGLTEKQQDWAQLALCAGAIYGVRFYAIAQRKKLEKQAEAPQRASIYERAV